MKLSAVVLCLAASLSVFSVAAQTVTCGKDPVRKTVTVPEKWSALEDEGTCALFSDDEANAVTIQSNSTEGMSIKEFVETAINEMEPKKVTNRKEEGDTTIIEMDLGDEHPTTLQITDERNGMATVILYQGTDAAAIKQIMTSIKPAK